MPLCACLGAKGDVVEKQRPAEEAKQDAKVAEQSTTLAAKKKIYVTRNIHEDALSILRERYEVEVWESENRVPRDKLMNDVKEVSAIICTVSDTIDADVLDAAGPSLKMIASMTSGLSHIDQDACEERGVALSHVADLCADVNAEMTCALLLVTARRCIEGRDAVRRGEWGLWKPMWILGIEFGGRTLGILGFGRVGLGVAKRMKPFGIARIIYYDKHEHPQAGSVDAELVASPGDLFKESDFIVCCMALTPETRGFIDDTKLSLCKPECVLINTARAELVNQDHLLQAIKAGKLTGVGLDVTTPEPLPPTHPLLAEPSCVVVPHMGTATTASRKRMAVHLANSVVDALN